MHEHAGDGLAARIGVNPVVRQVLFAGLMVLGLVLAACSAGQPSPGFISPELMNAYIPLSAGGWTRPGHRAAAVAIAPEIAVTNDHNLNIIPPERVLARSRDYDLLYFRTGEASVPPVGEPRMGEAVIAYGQGGNESLREARGRIAALGERVGPRCSECPTQRALVFEADAGRGFSGGPVVDAQTGAVLGVTFGYLDGKPPAEARRMYAYDIDLVMAEMHRLLDRHP
jgi:hypothetical protein